MEFFPSYVSTASTLPNGKHQDGASFTKQAFRIPTNSERNRKRQSKKKQMFIRHITKMRSILILFSRNIDRNKADSRILEYTMNTMQYIENLEIP